jgi:hypothetical protein
MAKAMVGLQELLEEAVEEGGHQSSCWVRFSRRADERLL